MQRLKGQETNLITVGPEGVETGLIDVKSFELSYELESLSEGYIGETTERKDDIFKGVSGTIEIHLETGDFFDFVTRVKDRAQRRSPAAGQFNLVSALSFPNGERKRILLEDVFFGGISQSIGSREDYVSASIEWVCADARFI